MRKTFTSKNMVCLVAPLCALFILLLATGERWPISENVFGVFVALFDLLRSLALLVLAVVASVAWPVSVLVFGWMVGREVWDSQNLHGKPPASPSLTCSVAAGLGAAALIPALDIYTFPAALLAAIFLAMGSPFKKKTDPKESGSLLGMIIVVLFFVTLAFIGSRMMGLMHASFGKYDGIAYSADMTPEEIAVMDAKLFSELTINFGKGRSIAWVMDRDILEKKKDLENISADPSALIFEFRDGDSERRILCYKSDGRLISHVNTRGEARKLVAQSVCASHAHKL